MMSVSINANFKTATGRPDGAFDKSVLRRVRVEYYGRDDAITPLGTGTMLVPANTDLAALEHMLELWSLATNREELTNDTGSR